METTREQEFGGNVRNRNRIKTIILSQLLIGNMLIMGLLI
jgi:hypothetical protein